MAVDIHDSIRNVSAKPDIAYQYQESGAPWASIAGAHNGCPSDLIIPGRLRFIDFNDGRGPIEYWYKGGKALENLVPRYENLESAESYVAVLEGLKTDGIASKNASKISENNSKTSENNAKAYRDAIQLIADIAPVNANVYASEAIGRAAVADDKTFLVQGSGDIAAYLYRRLSSTNSSLITAYASNSALVTPGKTTFLKIGINIFNKDASYVDNSTINATTGAVQTSVGTFTNRVFDFMDIEPSTIYGTNSGGGVIIAEYDANKTFVKLNSAINGSLTITTDAKTRLMRVSRFQSADFSILQIQKGTFAGTYVPFAISLDEKYLGKALLKTDLDVTKIITTDALNLALVPLLGVGKNLFNKDGAYLDWSQISPTTGAIQTNNPSFPTKLFDFIPVKSSTFYVSNSTGTLTVSEFDSGKAWIKNTGISGATNLQTNALTAYVRLTRNRTADLSTLQFEEGQVSTTPEPYRLQLNSNLSKSNILDAVAGSRNSIISPSKQYFLSGRENSIYFPSIIKRWDRNAFPTRITGTGVLSFNSRATRTPTVNQSLTIEMYDADFNLVESKAINTIISNPSTDNGTINALSIGDSYTNPTDIQIAAKAICPNVNFVGTIRGRTNISPAVYAEGRSGWTMEDYFTESKFHTTLAFYSPFQQPSAVGFNLYYGGTQTWISVLATGSTHQLYDTAIRVGFDPVTGLKISPATGDVMWVETAVSYKYWDGSTWQNTTATAVAFTLNFTKYRSAYIIPMPNIMTIMLGINDFSALKPSGVPAVYSTFKARLDSIILAAKADNPAVKFGVLLPTSFFPDHYDNAGGNFSKMKSACMMVARASVIADYDGRESESIYVVDTASALDSVYGFHSERGTRTGFDASILKPFYEYVYAGEFSNEYRPILTDGIHPDGNGYPQMGTRLAAFIQAVR